MIPDQIDPMYQWAKDLWPICRSLTGQGVRDTIAYLGTLIPGLQTHSIRSGEEVFDWIVPEEWNISGAYIEGPDGSRIVDFADSNLHVVNYSEPVDMTLSLEELLPHLYTLPDMPDAIPYVTSYFRRRWGFCMTERQKQALVPGRYRVKIDSVLAPGVLDYADLVLPGESEEEILLSTYICHPSLANNELSGPVVTAALARWLQGQPRRYTYRIVFVPETLGAIVYLATRWQEMKRRTVAGFVVTCVGDERAYSFLSSRMGNTLPDRMARRTLADMVGEYCSYPFTARGSDERQYCSPLIDLPVVSIMRTKYGEYPEYHTSLDDLDLVSQEGLSGAFRVLQKCIQRLERNYHYKAVFLGEPQLGKRGLYPSFSTRETFAKFQTLSDVLGYADGVLDLLQISEAIKADFDACADVAETLHREGLLTRSSQPS